MKEVVHVISHSHWDREWYLPYEKHHMRLIELIDDLLELFQKDPAFRYFHLDGQTIILEDYLEVRPEKEQELRQAVQAGKLKIGPFYILQDALLTSSESNVRNMLVGMETVKKWGVDPVSVGYFPDTFGNMGQAAQILQQGGIDVAAFGRGVKPTGFNNVVINDDKYTSPFSEMWWQGPDGSKVLGLLFANWYSNGNEIPSEREAARTFWNEKLADAKRYASTNQLLMMNGCDHQPVQKDLSAAIQLANELYPEIEFVHSNFDDYLKAVRAELPADLNQVEGELTSQESDGWYTLANTASARIYLKQANTKVSRLLENIAEPLSVMAGEAGKAYPHDPLRYAWKKLMQNHPHDSICGCSVDEVHRTMVERFAEAEEVADYIATEAADYLAAKVDTSAFPADAKPFVVWNTAGARKTGSVIVEIEWERILFAGHDHETLYDKLEKKGIPTICVQDSHGETVAFDLVGSEVRFGYDLPKDGFRVPYMARYVKVALFLEEMPAFSWRTYALVQSAEATEIENLVSAEPRVMENDYLRVQVGEDGTVAVFDKQTGTNYEDVLYYEETGDIGNEYIFFEPTDSKRIYSKDGDTAVTMLSNTANVAEIEIVSTMMVPHSADDTLAREQKAIKEFRRREAKRSVEMVPFVIHTTLRLEKYNRQLQVFTAFDNQVKDHRLRAIIQTDIHAEQHQADSIFETVTRPNRPAAVWENPTNPQHQHQFVHLADESKGITVSNYGLNEYEILNEAKPKIALTLLRSVGELGDWGYFPTPEAQCLGAQQVAFAIEFHQAGEETATYQRTKNFQIPFTFSQTGIHTGTQSPEHHFLEVEGDAFSVTALKYKEASSDLLLRGYNLTERIADLHVRFAGKQLYRSNLLEEKTGAFEGQIKGAEIVTLGFENTNHIG